MRAKKLLSLLLAAAMALSLVPATAFAAGEVCEIVETGVQYTDIGTAFAAVNTGETRTIRLLATTTYSNTITVNNKTVTIATNGFTFTLDVADNHALLVQADGKLLLDDSGGGAFNVTIRKTTSSMSTIYGIQVSGDGSEGTVTNVYATTSYCQATQATGGGVANVKGNVSSISGYAADAEGSGSVVNVQGNASAETSYTTTRAYSGGTVNVQGNATNNDGFGALAFGSGSVVNVYGNISSSNNDAIRAYDGEVNVHGNVSAPIGIGANAINGTIIVDGTITAATYIQVNSASKTAAQFENPPSPAKTGYRTYTNGGGTVHVKGTAPTIGGGATASTDVINLLQGYSAAHTKTYTIGGGDAIATTSVSIGSPNTAGASVSAAGVLSIPTGLTAGTYTATFTAGNGVASDATMTVTVNVIAPTYGVSLSETGTYTFTAATFGYAAQTARTVTVNNTGNQATGALSIALSGTNAANFTLSDTSITDIAVSGSDSFTVVPNTGLGAGTYAATVTVSGGNSISSAFSVSFTVNGGGGGGGGSGSYTPPTNPPANPPATPPDDGSKTTDLGGGTTVDTPPGQDPIDNGDGSFTLPGGGTITTPGRGADGSGGITIEAPPGTVIDNDGRIAFPPGSGGATITDSYGNTFNVPEDAVIILDLDTPLGYFISIGNPFTDVKESDWFYNAVMFAYSHGLMIGTSASPMMFSPNATTTRGMIVTVLYRMAGSPDVSGLENPFGDVEGGTWYTDAVKWAAANGIVSGVGGGLYDPNAPITRQDLAVILARYADFMGIPLPGAQSYTGFTDDADIANYAKEAIERFFRAGIIGGYPDGSMKPQDEATRAEVAAMLMRFLEAME